MKLAEALQERADLNRSIMDLRNRLEQVMLVQEGMTISTGFGSACSGGTAGGTGRHCCGQYRHKRKWLRSCTTGYVKALAQTFYGIPETELISAEGLDMIGTDVKAILRDAAEKIYITE